MAGSGDGQHAVLTTVDDQIYRGILHSVDENNGKIVLKNVVVNGTKLPGIQNFYASNIKDLELPQGLQDYDNPLKDSTKGNKNLRFLTNGELCIAVPLIKTSLMILGRKRLQYKKDKPQHLTRLLRFDSDDLVRSPCHCGGYDSGDQGIGSSMEENDNFEDFYEESNFTLFCRTCDKFRESIVYLMEQDVVAVSFFGVDISRNGALSLIQVATEEAIIMYDIVRLGREGFLDGLQAVLESNDVTKVIHDCRMASDLLYHQYEVTLSNVFDTQVACVFVFRFTNGGDWPRFVESLPSALITHLGLKNADVHHFYVRERLKQRDEEVWLQRPLCSKLLKDSMKNLVHMLPLYHTLQSKMMTEFNIGIQLYLEHVRNAPQDRADHYKTFGHLLPFVFQDLPQLATHAARQSTPFFRKSTSLDSNGFVEVCQTRCNTSVTTSRDSIWHSKKSFSPVTKCESKKSEIEVKHECRRSQPSQQDNRKSGNLQHSLSSHEKNQILTDLPRPEKEIHSPTSSASSPEHKATSFISPAKQLFKSDYSDSENVPCRKPETSSVIEKSALMRLVSPSYSSRSSNCSEISSDPDILDAKQVPPTQDEWDVDKILEFELSQKILKQARLGHSKSETKKRLLPPKVKQSPKSGTEL